MGWQNLAINKIKQFKISKLHIYLENPNLKSFLIHPGPPHQPLKMRKQKNDFETW